MTKKDQARSRTLRDALGALGYPGFVNLFTEIEAEFNHDPAIVLMAALSCNHLDERVVEALPWLVLRYPDMDWQWMVREARRRNAQNRLGFVVGLALRVAASSDGNMEKLARLSSVEEELFEYRLEKEDAQWQRVAPGQRESLRESRSNEAKQWRLLTELTDQDLAYSGDV